MAINDAVAHLLDVEEELHRTVLAPVQHNLAAHARQNHPGLQVALFHPHLLQHRVVVSLCKLCNLDSMGHLEAAVGKEGVAVRVITVPFEADKVIKGILLRRSAVDLGRKRRQRGLVLLDQHLLNVRSCILAGLGGKRRQGRLLLLDQHRLNLRSCILACLGRKLRLRRLVLGGAQNLNDDRYRGRKNHHVMVARGVGALRGGGDGGRVDVDAHGGRGLGPLGCGGLGRRQHGPAWLVCLLDSKLPSRSQTF
mmetsp:Transcript_37784/g.94719  ORF Transcript_37784/g.94719 Transcript_37784/m.94719 type:complete len:252 (+) Transcript_37784:637-1392(+)